MALRHRPRLAAALALGLALALLLGVSPASALVWIERYTLDVTVPPAGEPAPHTLTLHYRASGERKTNGFKFVGPTPIGDLWATDGQGKPLRVRASREASSGEYKIEFDLPTPEEHKGNQAVKIGFRQPLSIRGYGWGSRTVEIPWAPTFRIPVDTMEVTISGPSGLGAPGSFTCKGKAPASCTRLTRSTAPVQFTLPSAESGASLAGMLAALVLAGGAMLLGVRSRYRALLALRGVVPPASPVAYPAWGYHAPPPLPVEQVAEPVLPGEERSTLLRRVVIGAGVLLFAIVLVAVLASGRAPVQMPILVGILALIGALLLWPFLAAEKVLAWLPTAVLALSIGILVTSSLAGLAFGIAPIFIWMITLIPSGGGSSSSSSGSSCGSSSCGSSSCGGGGGGCGGGGGGGGCGG